MAFHLHGTAVPKTTTLDLAAFGSSPLPRRAGGTGADAQSSPRAVCHPHAARWVVKECRVTATLERNGFAIVLRKRRGLNVLRGARYSDNMISRIHRYTYEQIESKALPGPSAVISMADSEGQLPVIKDTANVRARLNLIFNDATESYQLVRPPSSADAQAILQFINANSHLPHFVVQCQVGIGRSMSVAAAVMKILGQDNKALLHAGPYNRRLYRLLLEASGTALDPEPLVSISIRVKYSPDRLRLFMLCMQRQRYENWEVIAVTDGPNHGAVQLADEINEPRLRLIETEKPLGYWGNPYRQRGIDACRGEFIGMSNDDNYYVPGYIEQMVNALENADLAICGTAHSYYGWEARPGGADLGCWIARAALVRGVPWPGNHFTADREFITALNEAAQDRRVDITKPLFVHN